jgi:hypothetical protein
LRLRPAAGSELDPFVDDVEGANFHCHRLDQETNRVHVASPFSPSDGSSLGILGSIRGLGLSSDNGRLGTVIIRLSPIRRHSVSASRLRPPHCCGLHCPGFGRSASTATVGSRGRLCRVTTKPDFPERRSRHLFWKHASKWNGELGLRNCQSYLNRWRLHDLIGEIPDGG